MACSNEAHRVTPSDAAVIDTPTHVEDGWGWTAPQDAETYAPTFYAVEESLLYLKITSHPCGELMPLSLGTSIPLEARRIEQIRQWIEAGAQPFEQRDGGTADATDTGL